MSEEQLDPKEPTYEVVEGLSQKILDEIDVFLNEELDKQLVSSDSAREDFTAELILDATHTIGAIQARCDMAKSLMVAARSDEKLVGFALFGIDSKGEVLNGYMGVGYDNIKKGIAKQLVRRGFDKLRSLGIKEYKASVHAVSKRVMESVLGYELIPLQSGQHLVRLKK